MTFQLRSITKILLGMIIFCLMSAVSYAQTVGQATMIKTDDPAAYLQKLEDGKALLKKLGSRGEMRAWRATIAGSNTGNISVVVEWPSMMAFAEDGEKVLNSSEWAAWIDSLSSIRTVLSVDFYTELDID